MPAGSSLEFSADDVDVYAAVSGDRNPLHLDAGFARRTAFGQRIVHGALVATALLGRLPEEARRGARALRVHLAGPVLVAASHTAVAEPRRDGPWPWEVRLTGRGKTLARLWVSEAAEPAPPGGPEAPPERPMRDEPAVCSPASLQRGGEIRGRYSAPRLLDLAGRFAAGDADPVLLAGLGCASYVAGMEVPGRHGLLAAIELSSRRAGGAITAYDLIVREVDERTGRVVVGGELLGDAGAGASMQIEAFVREPVLPAGRLPAAPAPRLGAAVVVIGASRGLGAAVTLDLLGRGYDVHAVFAESTSAAAELETRAAAAAGRLVLHQADAADAGAMNALAGSIRQEDSPLAGLVLNAAPPPLGMGLTAEAADDLAGYVALSVRLVATPLGALLALLPRDGGWVTFCSSAAVGEPPRDWPQYVAAKGAVEALASWVASVRPDLKTVALRPSKLATDLANTPAGRIGATPPAEVARSLVDYLRTAPAGLTTLSP